MIIFFNEPTVSFLWLLGGKPVPPDFRRRRRSFHNLQFFLGYCCVGRYVQQHAARGFPAAWRRSLGQSVEPARSTFQRATPRAPPVLNRNTYLLTNFCIVYRHVPLEHGKSLPLILMIKIIISILKFVVKCFEQL